MDSLKKLMEKKSKKGGMDPKKKEAKMELLGELRDMAKGMMMDDLQGHREGMKKVQIASDSDEGLKEGLEKAEDILESKMGESEDMEDESEMGSEMESEDEDFGSLSKEDLIAKLMKYRK